MCWKVLSPTGSFFSLLFFLKWWHCGHQDLSGSGSERNPCTLRVPASSSHTPFPTPQCLDIDMCSAIGDSWARPDEPVGHSGSLRAQTSPCSLNLRGKTENDIF